VRFNDHFIDEIKSRLRLSDVIGKTVKLRRQGREYVGLSPFNKEKTPSFYVNDDKGFYHDFSSGKNGDLISFLQETERLSFTEAVERLAAEAGVPLPAPDPRSAEVERERQSLSDWLEVAAKWFESALRRPEGAEARAYLARRGLPESEWARFRLGFSPPGRTALKDYLIAKGGQPRELVETGVLIAPEDGGAPYDRFRDRIIFPITDARGRVVSFGGRAMDLQARAKYLNGPETSLFHKGGTLYGLAEARKLLAAAADGSALVVVEGYMDAIACQRAGVAAVAPLGTALTEDQMEAVWRLHPEPTLCFDGDAAGQRAASRVVDRALPLLKPGRSFRFALVTGGKDPDDVLRDQGAAALKAQLAQTRSFVETLFTRERDLQPLDTPERRTAFKVGLRKLAAMISDADLSHAYREDLLGRYEALWPLRAPVYTVGAAAREMARRRWDSPRGSDVTTGAKAAAKQLEASPWPLAAALAVAAIEMPSVMDGRIESLAAHGFAEPGLEELASQIVSLRFETDRLEADVIKTRLALRGFDDEAFRRLIHHASFAGVGAPFLQPDLSLERVRELWSQAFDLLMDLQALERALAGAKEDMVRDNDSSTLFKLKLDRDLLKRKLESGSWAEESERSVH